MGSVAFVPFFEPKPGILLFHQNGPFDSMLVRDLDIIGVDHLLKGIHEPLHEVIIVLESVGNSKSGFEVHFFAIREKRKFGNSQLAHGRAHCRPESHLAALGGVVDSRTTIGNGDSRARLGGRRSSDGEVDCWPVFWASNHDVDVVDGDVKILFGHFAVGGLYLFLMREVVVGMGTPGEEITTREWLRGGAKHRVFVPGGCRVMAAVMAAVALAGEIC